ncbi:hypothetical protein [Bordetella sp. FB-8]|uniref:hypothetical protein n=1 Tax=Bordetella sp. FB-8 TaxID=1159870 RepID=UPI00036430F0|nr:hypothetical protein [Bordetella sp. FB-8]
MSNQIGFHICLVGKWLEDMGQAYQWALRELGYEASLAQGAVSPDRVNLLFAGFGVPLNEYRRSGLKHAININLEQVGTSLPVAITANAFALLREFPVWDYSPRNLEQLPQYGIADLQHVPVGYCPLWERLPRGGQDIDVVFYGALSQRRIEVLKKLELMGLTVAYPRRYDEWSLAQRDQYISRAKVVLNLSFYEQVHILEEVRISFLLANSKAVVSEIRGDTYAHDDVLQGLAAAPLEDIPALCAALCADVARRENLEQAGYHAIRGRDWLTPLRRAVENYLSRANFGYQSIKPDLPIPRKLNLGSGKNWKFDFLNLDIEGTCGADVVLDLNLPLDHERLIDSWRFGKVKLPREGFEYILAERVFEQVRNLTQCMQTCLDLLEDGGMLEIEVAYDLSLGAWDNPSHVRAFNERSWLYYSDGCEQIGWRNHRFDVQGFAFKLSDYGDELRSQGRSEFELARTPRAVETMRVQLKKRPL